MDASRAAVVSSVFRALSQRSAYGPNVCRPACGLTYVPRFFDPSISARNALASFLVLNVFAVCLPVRSRQLARNVPAGVGVTCPIRTVLLRVWGSGSGGRGGREPRF